MVLLVSSVPRTRTETPKAAPFRRWTKQQRADQSRATGPTEKLQEWGRELAGGADLEERVAAVRRRAVGADAGAAPEAEDVLLVLLAGLVRGAADEEGLRDQAGDPPAGHHPRLSIPRRTGSPAPPPLGRLGREGGRNSLSLSLLLLLGRGNSICSVSSLSLARALDLFRGGVPGYVEVACLVAVRREGGREGGG
jgi:hypothetical protein